jgi:transposase
LEVPAYFLGKGAKKKGICSIAYLNQVLNPIVFPWFDSLIVEQKEEFLFMEDRAKIHKGMAKLPRKLRGLRRFDWPPSSPDLNLIEKVWR